MNDLRERLLAALKTRYGRKVQDGHTAHFPCPRHDDQRPSGWMRDKAWGCMACGFQEPLYTLADLLGVERPRDGYTVEQYAQDKGLDLAQLRAWGVETDEVEGSVLAVAIPYKDATGKVLRRRFRVGRKMWWEGVRQAIHPYGLDVLAAKPEAAVFVVEGESDCHTLWTHDLVALGIPGANAWKSEWKDHLKGREVFVWQEPGDAAVEFVKAVSRDLPDARVITAPNGIKDPNELHKNFPITKDFVRELRGLARDARKAGVPEAPVPFDILLGPTLDYLKEQLSQPIDAVPVPWAAWAKCCRGFGGGVGIARGWHVVVGGLTGHGKSLIATNLTASGIQFGERPTLISLEMEQHENAVRTMAVVGDVPVYKLEPGKYFDEAAFNHCRTVLENVYRTNGGCIIMNRRRIRKLVDVIDAMKYCNEVMGSRFFLVDYLQLAQLVADMDIRERMEEVSDKILQTTVDLKVATVSLSQFNRQQSSQRDERPISQGLQGGSSLENDAAQVLLMDHSRYEKLALLGGRRIANTYIIVDKNRHGPTGDIPIEIASDTLRIRERMEEQEAA